MIESMTADVAFEFSEDIQTADELLREIVNAGRKPNVAEMTYFRRRLNWDERTINEQYRRMASVVRLQAIAGSPQDREAASAEATRAAEVLESESPKIAEQIAKLQAKLGTLERDARLSAKRCEEQAKAVEQLRSHVPDHIRQEADALAASIYQSLGRPLAALKSRQETITKVLAGDYSDKRSHMNWAAKLDPAAVVRREDGRYIVDDWSPSWAAIKQELATELEELPAKIEAAQAAYDTEMIKVDALRNYYTKG